MAHIPSMGGYGGERGRGLPLLLRGRWQGRGWGRGRGGRGGRDFGYRPSETTIETGPYRPLDVERHEIRILRLEPGAFDDEIQISLEVVSLDDQPNYEALSYAWGTTFSPRNVLVDGKYYLTVTENLDCALRHLRYRKEYPRMLWVDAVCTNQNDLEERGHQVQLMGTVYSAASEVLIWLGPNQNQFDQLIRYLTYHVIPASFDDRSTLLHEAARSRTLPWFSRLWVVQEFVLSTNDPILCIGRRTFRWSTSAVDIEQFLGLIYCTYVMDQPTKSPDLVENYIEVSKLHTFASLREQTKRQSLFKRLAGTQSLWTSDPRDKVYGILGISTFTSSIVPDYTSSVQAVFARAVTVMLRDNEVRFFTGRALQTEDVTGCKNSPDWPSWVPDLADWLRSFREGTHWRPDYILRRPVLHPYEHRQPITAATCLAKVACNYKNLFATGRIIGSVSWKSTPGSACGQEVIHWIHETYHRSLEQRGFSPTSFLEVVEDDPEVWDGYGGPDFNERSAAFIQLLQSFTSLDHKLSIEYEQTLSKTTDDVRYRTVFATDQGHLGRSYHPAPDGILPGDLFVGLFGIDYPFLLRPLEDNKYRMINVAHVVGHKWGTIAGYEKRLPKKDWSDLEELDLRVFEIV